MFDTKKLKTFSWVNVGNPDHEDFERLLNEYKIDEDTISDIWIPMNSLVLNWKTTTRL